ncbi:MAG: fibronectin type III domain-containing protein [Gemmatimonadetes bacterium]|nr:fibronectin type III domain-containing protein [Gemmatimonadota bacterium]
MRIGAVVTMLLVGIVTQSCRIEMPSLVELMIRDFKPGTGVRFPSIYDLGKSRAVALQSGFKDTLIIADDPTTGHGKAMKDIFINTGVSDRNILFVERFGYVDLIGNVGLRELISNEQENLRNATRVVHIPRRTPLDTSEDPARLRSTDNILFILSAGNTYSVDSTYITDQREADRDLYNKNHQHWRDGNYEFLLEVRNTNKVLWATSAHITRTHDIEPNRNVVSCGDIKENCFTIIPGQYTSDASARLSAMAFYLSQLYPTEEEVRETLEVCAVDIGEPGIDREYGRGLANLLCPRILEKELSIVSQYLQKEGETFTPKGGVLTGTWEAKGSALKVYMPLALEETLQPQYSGTVNGKITFKADSDSVTANFRAEADIEATFLMSITATAKDTLKGAGTYSTSPATVLTLKTGENTSRSYTYTATEDSLHLVHSLTLNEMLALLSGPIGDLADTVTKDLFASNPIQIKMSFAKRPEPKAPSMPQNVRQAGVTATTITLQWDPPADDVPVFAYHIVRYTDNSCTDIAESKGSAEQRVLFTDLVADTEYYFSVQGANLSGWSPQSSCITVRTQKTLLPADFNSDGIVNIPDFLLFVDVFGTREGDQNFDARMDLDGNGIVGIEDFLIFTAAFGQTA